MPPQPPRPPQPHKPRFRWYEHPATVGSAVGATTLLLGVALGVASAPTSASASKPEATVTKPAPTVTKTTHSTAKPTVTKTKTQKVRVTKTIRREPKAKAKIPGDGTFKVGDDIKPGTYRGKPAFGGTCYWARMSDASGTLDAVIANDNISGPSIVTINSGEYFKTRGCDTWKKQ